MPLIEVPANPIQQERERTNNPAPTPGGRGRPLKESEWVTPGEQKARENLEKLLPPKK